MAGFGVLAVAAAMLASVCPSVTPRAAAAPTEAMTVLTGRWAIGPVPAAPYPYVSTILSGVSDLATITATYRIEGGKGRCHLDLTGTLSRPNAGSGYSRQIHLDSAQFNNDCAGPLTVTVNAVDSATGAHLNGTVTTSLQRAVRITSLNATPEPVRRYAEVTTKARVERADWDTGTYTAYHAKPITLERRDRYGHYDVAARVKPTKTGRLAAAVAESHYSCWRYAFAGAGMSGAADSSADCVYVTGQKRSVVGPANNFQVNAQHDGEAGGPGLPASLHRLWAIRPTVPAYVDGYPIIAGGRVFAMILNDPDTSQYLINAYGGKSGKLLWSTPFQANGPSASLAYATGRLFFANEGGQMLALDARNGHIEWERIDPYFFGSSPAVAAEDMVFAIDDNNSLDAWRQDDDPRGRQVTYGSGGDLGFLDPYAAAAVTEHGLYLTEGPDVAASYPFDKTKKGWMVGFPNAGDTAATVVHDGQVWSRDSAIYPAPGKVYSTKNGRLLGTFAGNNEPPVFDGHTALTIRSAPGTADPGPELIALDTRTLKVKWTRNGVGSGMAVAGHVVYVGRGSSSILGISTKTGHTVWSGKVSGYVASATQGVFGMSGINIGDQLLAVPDGKGLVVFGG